MPRSGTPGWFVCEFGRLKRKVGEIRLIQKAQSRSRRLELTDALGRADDRRRCSDDGIRQSRHCNLGRTLSTNRLQIVFYPKPSLDRADEMPTDGRVFYFGFFSKWREPSFTGTLLGISPAPSIASPAVEEHTHSFGPILSTGVRSNNADDRISFSTIEREKGDFFIRTAVGISADQSLIKPPDRSLQTGTPRAAPRALLATIRHSESH